MVIIITIPILLLIFQSELRNRRLDSIRNEIMTYPNSILIFQNKGSLSPATGSINCGVIYTLDLYGVDNPNTEVVEFFREQLAGKDWYETEGDRGVFVVDDKTKVIIAPVLDAMSMVSFGMNTSDFRNAQGTYETLYRIYISNSSRTDCK